jgi:hypothetical protein
VANESRMLLPEYADEQREHEERAALGREDAACEGVTVHQRIACASVRGAPNG